MAAADEPERGYRPIADYAAVGDCHGCALVASDGGIDWYCPDRFDAQPLFSRLLDARRGGFLSIGAEGLREVSRAYVDGTNILRTRMRTSTGAMTVTDFMPVGRQRAARANDYVKLAAPGWLVRSIEVTEGRVELQAAMRAMQGERDAARPDPIATDLRLEGLPLAVRSDLPWRVEGDLARSAETLEAGSRRFIALAPESHRVDRARIEALLATTRAYWREWLAYSRYRGPYRDVVERSALALKLLTYAPCGTCAAAMTTSLPERIGGERNWDYRYCWIRDASLMLHALSALGYSGEAGAFFRFLCDRLAEGPEKLQVMYGVDGGRQLAERELDGIEGYRGSRPVRVGNAAHAQNQTDIYGYVLEGALVYRELGGTLRPEDRAALAAVADFIEGCWPIADAGLWETRGPPRHFVHSKAMCWVAVDRAVNRLLKFARTSRLI